jgi:hypothetical protein
MAKFTKVPSQVRSGVETFSDNLVGVQITDGSSQLTNTTFAIDRVLPEKDSKTFSSKPFSDFLTLDTLKEETTAPKTNTSGSSNKNETIKFKGAKDDAGKSLYGSLRQRVGVSITRIIEKFPAGLLIDNSTIAKISEYTAESISYDLVTNVTTFKIQDSLVYNPFDIVLSKPDSNTTPTTTNEFRNFYSSFKNYTLLYSGVTYDIINYTQPDIDGVINFKVKGRPFNNSTRITNNFIIRPNDSFVEEFFKNLDDVEELLLNRETSPKYTAQIKVPRDNYENTYTDVVGVGVTWPIARDGWNIQIVGLEFEKYIDNLNSLADEVDDYKSNIVVRFLTAPQLFEFDSEDKKAESIFQLYGQSFDSVKKYIDNIAYMRHVSYDGIKNLPDVLLKNLSQNLGLNTINLFDEKSFNDTLYTRQNSTYGGVSVGKNLIESEYEFYRRLLINLSGIYKSKGTRKSLEFFLKFLGAPEPMVKINEYVYDVTKLPNKSTLEDDLYDVINGIKTDYVITGFTESTTGVTYEGGMVTQSSSLTRDEYPIDTDGLPRKVTNLSNDIFFQKGAGWYDMTLDHRSSLEIDYENSQLTGRLKYTKTKNKAYTYGEDYFDNFRKFPSLDYGFEITSRIDNQKTSNLEIETDSKLILNRKNISVNLSPSQTIDYDVWRQSRNLELDFGTLPVQSQYSFAEFMDNVLSKTIINSSTVRYEKNYIRLEDVYTSYVNSVNASYDFISLNEYVNKMSPYWTQIIEQFVPSSTLWTGGNVIENGKFGRSKYRHIKPCQIFEMVDDIYPNFQQLVEEQPDNNIFKFYPTFVIDGVNYSGSTRYATMSGTTNTSTSASLVTPDYNKLKQLWLSALQGLLTDLVTPQINVYGNDYDYGTKIGYSAITNRRTAPMLSYEIFINENGDEKIKFKSYKYGPSYCTVLKSFDFSVTTDYSNYVINCDFEDASAEYIEDCRFTGASAVFSS